MHCLRSWTLRRSSIESRLKETVGIVMLIVTASDDNYVPGVLVLIASASHHNPTAAFAVLSLGIGDDNRRRIAELGSELGIAIQLISAPLDAFEKLIVRRSHLTRACYLRLLIPSLFPDIGRALYMDCDMVVVDSLGELENLALGDQAIAAASCPTVGEEEVQATSKTKGTYINSGLLVMNLDVWRRDAIGQRCLELLAARSRKFFCEDQSVINIVCGNSVTILPARYNVYADITSYADVSLLPSRPAVLHYVVRNKPWSRVTTADEIWHYHAGRIARLMPPLKIEQRRISRFHKRCKLAFGLLRRRKKYLDRREVERKWRSFSQAYLATMAAPG